MEVILCCNKVMKLKSKSFYKLKIRSKGGNENETMTHKYVLGWGTTKTMEIRKTTCLEGMTSFYPDCTAAWQSKQNKNSQPVLDSRKRENFASNMAYSTWNQVRRRVWVRRMPVSDSFNSHVQGHTNTTKIFIFVIYLTTNWRMQGGK